MDPQITRRVVDEELSQLEEMLEQWPGKILERGEEPPSVRLRLESNRDEEIYYLEGLFDEYPQKPPLWEFYDPQDDEKGKPKHYPKDEGKHGLATIFLDDPVICHPGSRRAYAGYTGKHDKWEMREWRTIENDNVNDIPMFIQMILTRINSDLYQGRMAT